MNTSMKLIASALVVLGMILAGCAETMQKPSASLYDRLGGKGAITAVVDDFIGNVAADKRINGRFANANIPHLKEKLVEQICAGSGGPCTYTGLDMKTAHAGMKITDAEFGALVEDLVKTLDKFKVPAQEKNELLGILGPMKKDIVGV
ncbi:MAG: group 1 truncated hemoglobin [Gammaproteobacteria bacterium]|nr:group 1 truncated hemoglobin [Gammaproteobacteria bacterium]